MQKKNVFQKYIDERLISVHSFATKSGLKYGQLNRIYRGVSKPSRLMVLKLQKATGGEIKLEDFGYE